MPTCKNILHPPAIILFFLLPIIIDTAFSAAHHADAAVEVVSLIGCPTVLAKVSRNCMMAATIATYLVDTVSRILHLQKGLL